MGRVAVRARGSFNIRTATGTVTDEAAKWCRLVQRVDGYAYAEQLKGGALLPLPA